MKRIFLLTAIGGLTILLDAKASGTLSLDTCYAKARQQYPLIKQKELLARSKEYSVDNTSKGYLPQFNISGQAPSQSAVTQFPISFPGVNIPALPKDQYKMYGE